MKDYLSTEQFNALMLITRKYERNQIYDAYEFTPALKYLVENNYVISQECIRTNVGKMTYVFKPTPKGWKIITKKDMPVDLINKPLPESKADDFIPKRKDWRDREADLWANDL